MKKLTLAIPAESHKKLKVLAAQTETTMVGILLKCIDERYEEYFQSTKKENGHASISKMPDMPQSAKCKK